MPCRVSVFGYQMMTVSSINLLREISPESPSDVLISSQWMCRTRARSCICRRHGNNKDAREHQVLGRARGSRWQSHEWRVWNWMNFPEVMCDMRGRGALVWCHWPLREFPLLEPNTHRWISDLTVLCCQACYDEGLDARLCVSVCAVMSWPSPETHEISRSTKSSKHQNELLCSIVQTFILYIYIFYNICIIHFVCVFVFCVTCTERAVTAVCLYTSEWTCAQIEIMCLIIKSTNTHLQYVSTQISNTFVFYFRRFHVSFMGFFKPAGINVVFILVNWTFKSKDKGWPNYHIKFSLLI